MATDVELPQLGESVTEGTITAWLVEVGDTVEADQPLFELSSDKIDTEVPSPASGVLTEVLVGVDETVEVGTVVARIGDASEAAGAGGGGDTADQAMEAAEGEDPASGQEQLHDAGDSAPGGRGGEADLHASGDDSGGAAEGPEPAAEPEAGADRPAAGGDAGGSGGGGGPAVDVVLPELGESVTEGTITAWLVEVGQEVQEDQPLFELSSDKIDTEVPSPASGVLTEILVDVDETVDVGTVVARLGGGGGGAAAGGGGAEQPAPAAQQGGQDGQDVQGTSGDYERVPEDQPAPAAGDAPAGPDTLASPLVRKLAAEGGVDLSSLQGSGQGGRITREDVEAAISGGGAQQAGAQQAQPAQAQPRGTGKPGTDQQTSPAKKPGGQPSKGSSEPREPARAPGDRERVEDLSRIRQRIADKMMESIGGSAQLTTVQEADVTAMMTARARHKDQFKQREGVSLSPFAMVARAALIAVRDHPMVNAYADWANGKLYLRDYVNLGIAVDTPKGLLVPNVKGADSLTVAGLARGIAEAAQKARGEGGKKLDFADIEGGTFTLTNTGSVGVLIDTPILNYPEVAILGVGAIVKRPAVITTADGGEAIAIRHMLYLSLTYDHRLLDGADAARYVTAVKHILEDTDWDQELS